MLLWCAPDMSVTPATEPAQFLHLLVLFVQVILDWQLGGVENADITPETMEDTRGLKGHEFRIRPASVKISTSPNF